MQWLNEPAQWSEQQGSLVVTADAAMADLPAGMTELVLRLTRRGDAVEIRYGVDDGEMELAALAYLPPGDQVLAGAMCAAPEGSGFQVTFHDLKIAHTA